VQYAGAYGDRYAITDAQPIKTGTQSVLAATVLACVIFASAWTIWAHVGGSGDDAVDTTTGDFVEVVGTRGDKLVIRQPIAQKQDRAPTHHYVWLFDPRPVLGPAVASFDTSDPLPGDDTTAVAEAAAPMQVAAASTATPASPKPAAAAVVPIPVPRVTQIPTVVANAPAPAATPAKPTSAQTASRSFSERKNQAFAAARNIFEKLFGKPAPVALAYANAEDHDTDAPGLVGGRYDRYTAVYDISARMVYLPNGTQLEAHSGLGSMLDDPRYANQRMRGVTPPTVYDLHERESLFHGVRALRLIPEDESKVFGRSGLLAHTYMLGPNGDSNGCVSFREYDRFLHAYLNHEIKRLAVVAHLD
jgi:hypothetical protein